MTLSGGRICRCTCVPSITVLCLLVAGGVLYWHYGTKTGVTVYADLEKRVVLPGPVLPDDVESHDTRRGVEEPECVKVGPGEVPPLGRVACSVDYHFTPPKSADSDLPEDESDDFLGVAHRPEPNLRGRSCDRPQGCDEELPPAPEYTEVCKDNQTQCVTLDKGIICIDSSLDCDVLDEDEYSMLRCVGPACNVGDVKPCPTILPGNKINCEELKAMLTPRVTKPEMKGVAQGAEVHKQQEDRDVPKVPKKEEPVYGTEFGLDLKPDAINKFTRGRVEKTVESDKGRKHIADELSSKDEGFGLDLNPEAINEFTARREGKVKASEKLPKKEAPTYGPEFGLDLDAQKAREYKEKKTAKAPKVVKPLKVYKDLELDLDLQTIQKKYGKSEKAPKKAQHGHGEESHHKSKEEPAAVRRVQDTEGLPPRVADAGYVPPGGVGRVITMPGEEAFRGRVEHGDLDLLD